MAKKRYYQGYKARRDEHLGEERMERRRDPRSDYSVERALERRDFEMISEDHSAPANLPKEAVMKDWPRTTYFDHADLEKWDNVRGIDRQMDEDANQASRHRSKSKY